MEFIKVIILTILLTLTITTPCGDNPALPKFEEFFYDVSADNPDFNVMLEEYLDMEPLTFTEGTLGHCGELF